MPCKYRKVCPICGKANILKLSDHLRQVQLSVEERQPHFIRSVMYCNTMVTECFSQHHLEMCSYPNFQLQSQSKWLGHFGVSLSPQCWCTRFGDQTAINNFERDEGSTRTEKTAFG